MKKYEVLFKRKVKSCFIREVDTCGMNGIIVLTRKGTRSPWIGKGDDRYVEVEPNIFVRAS